MILCSEKHVMSGPQKARKISFFSLKMCFQLNDIFFSYDVNITHNILILLLVCPPSQSDLIPFTEKNLCPLCAGNAAVVKPSELSEFSSLLLRALLPRYLDQV